MPCRALWWHDHDLKDWRGHGVEKLLRRPQQRDIPLGQCTLFTGAASRESVRDITEMCKSDPKNDV